MAANHVPLISAIFPAPSPSLGTAHPHPGWSPLKIHNLARLHRPHFQTRPQPQVWRWGVGMSFWGPSLHLRPPLPAIPTPSTAFPIVLPQTPIQLPSLGHLLVCGTQTDSKVRSVQNQLLGSFCAFAGGGVGGVGAEERTAAELSATSRPVVRMGSGHPAFRQGLRSVLSSLQWPVTVHPLNNRNTRGEEEKESTLATNALPPLPLKALPLRRQPREEGPSPGKPALSGKGLRRATGIFIGKGRDWGPAGPWGLRGQGL